MKHKLLTAVVATASALCFCLGLAACGDNGGTNGNVGGGNNSGEHEHVYTAENKCSVCGEKWEYTEGLEYELKGDTYAVKGIGTASGDIVLPYGYQGKFVTEIADNAFKGSEAVTGIYIPEKIALIGKTAFADCANLEHATWDAENCNKAGMTYEEVMKNGQQSYNPTEFLIFWDAGLKSLTIGERAKIIPDCAFMGCSTLTGEVKIPDSVTKIGYGAFASSGLSAVTIGDGVTEIGGAAFSDCDSLVTVEIGDGLKQLVGHYTGPEFGFCKNLKYVILGSGITQIGADAFAESYAIESIRYNGTVEEWQAIDKKAGWDYSFTNDYTITCTNGTIAKDGTVTLA